MTGLFIDLSPLRRFPQFRSLWFGYAISQLGSQLTVVAVAYQVYRLTHSSFDVGLISLAQLGPSIVGPVFGGSLADAFDRRRVLIFTNLGSAACTGALLFNTESHHASTWPLFVFAGMGAGVSGIDTPTRSATMLVLVDKDSFSQANALRALLQQIAYVVGPAAAGALLAGFGIAAVYIVDIATFAVAAAAVLSIDPVRPVGGGTSFGFRSIFEGFAYLRGRQALQAVFVADLDAMVFGMPNALFPALGIAHFHGGAEAVGYLYAAPGLGAFIAAILSGWIGQIRRPGRAVLICVTVWGLGIAAFGTVSILWLALVFLAIAGGADVISAVFRQTILQTETPDRLRGRISSIQSAVVQAGPRLGNTEAGIVAQLSTAQISVVSGGIACVLGVLVVARLMPKFARYDIEVARRENEETVPPADPTAAG